MGNYAKVYKALEMCAAPDCDVECPYYGETRGGKSCRAWLLNDAAVALAKEESRAEGAEKQEPAHGVVDVMKVAMQAIKDAEYWRGQADALKWCLHDRSSECTVEESVEVKLPETEAGSHV